MKEKNIINPNDIKKGKMFPVWTTQYFKKYILDDIDANEKDPAKTKKGLQKYQEFVYSFLDSSQDFRNVLIYHDLGSGKTITAINIMNLLFSKEKKNIVVLLPASLRDSTWNKSLKTWSSEAITNNLFFISYNSSNFEKKFSEVSNTLDETLGTLYFIDESHNFIHNVFSNMQNDNAVSHSGALNVYNTILSEKKINPNIRIIALSATPVMSHPFEYAILFNLLRDNSLPNRLSQFEEIFMNDSVDNRNMFMRRILGLVSYYKNNNKENFPEVKISQIHIKMSSYQEKMYESYRLKESTLNTGSGASSFYIYTRNASNFVFPTSPEKKIMGDKRPRPNAFSSKTEYEKELKRYSRAFKELLVKNVSSKELKNDFLLCREKYKSNFAEFIDKEKKNLSKSLLFLYTHSCKMTNILFNVFSEKRKHVVFSNFVIGEGLEIMKIYLETLNISHCEFHGLIDLKKRSKNIEDYNKKNNLYGEQIKVLLLSQAGLEGIDLSNVGFIHILDPSWNSGKEKQLIGRGARFNSHAELPGKDRTVSVFKYFSSLREGTSTDVHVENLSIKNEKLKEHFSDLVQRSAIDCELFKKHNFPNDNNYMCFHFSENTYARYLMSKESGPAHLEQFDNYNNDGLFSPNSKIVKKTVRKIKVYSTETKKTSMAWLDDTNGHVYDIYFETILIGILRKNDWGFFVKYNKDTYLLSTSYDF